MTAWQAVWACFGLTVVVLVIDFWQARRLAAQVRQRMALSVNEAPTDGSE